MFLCKKTTKSVAAISPDIIDTMGSDLHLLLSKASKLCIISHLLTSKPYPYRTSFDLLVRIIQVIRQSFHGEVILTEKLFSDSKLEYLTQNEADILQSMGVVFQPFAKEELVEVENRYSGENKLFNSFFAPRCWVDADVRLVIASASVHKHHAIQYFHGIDAETALMLSVSTFDWRKVKRSEAISIYRDQLSDMLFELKGQQLLECYGIVDAREIPITNEHLFISKIKRSDSIISGWDHTEIDSAVYRDYSAFNSKN